MTGRRSSAEVAKAASECFGGLHCTDPSGGARRPCACISCNHLVKARDARWIEEGTPRKNHDLFQEKERAVPSNINLREDHRHPSAKTGCMPWMDACLASPRASSACNVKKETWRHSCCRLCHSKIARSGEMPHLTISNGNFTGARVERAHLCSGRARGHCFALAGGRAMQLKGALGRCKVDPKGIAGGIGFLHSLGAAAVILISGEMARAQKAKAKARAKMRAGAARKAAEWLVQSSAPWGSASAADWKTRFENRAPQVVDESEEIEDSENPCGAAVELTKKCCVHHPGGEAQGANGGQSSAEDFRLMVPAADQKGFALERACGADRQFIREEQRENTLVLANLAQFPHGRGGITETRQGSKPGEHDDDLGAEPFHSAR